MARTTKTTVVSRNPMNEKPLMYSQASPERSYSPGPPSAKRMPASTARTIRTRPGCLRIMMTSLVDGADRRRRIHVRAAAVPRSGVGVSRDSGRFVPSRLAGFAEPSRAGLLDGGGAVGHGELGQDPGHVVADGLLAQVQAPGDVPVPAAPAQFAQDVQLAGGQPGQGFGRRRRAAGEAAE